jgi:hypothetical protein
MIIGDSVPWVKYSVYNSEGKSLFNWNIFKGTGNSCPTILRESNEVDLKLKNGMETNCYKLYATRF